MSLPKVHTSSVAVVPPAAVWRRIQALRCFADKSFVRWPPHINLLYPFHPDAAEQLAAADGGESDGGEGGGRQQSVASRGSGGQRRGGARRSGPGQATAAEASLLSDLPAWDAPGAEVAGQLQLVRELAGSGEQMEDPFGQMAARAGRALAQVRLEQLRVFRHSSRSITAWADPVSVSHPTSGPGAGLVAPVGLVAVQALLEAEFPACTDLSADEGRGIRGFVPHLSLGQLRDERELEALQAAWEPVEWLVDSVQLISRSGYLTPFTVRYHVPFGLGTEGLDRDPAVAPGRTGYGLGRVVRRLDVPYVATLANLQPRHRQQQVQEEQQQQQPLNGDDALSLVEGFATPCLVLPPRPPQPSHSMFLQRSAGSAAPTSGAVAGVDLGAGNSRVARPGSAAAGAEVSADKRTGHGVGAPSVWWFAYGAALQASPHELGALESHPAVLPGRSYRLAFNRPGGRANLVPAGDPGQVPGSLAVHGVLHRLPLEVMARLLLVVHEACPTEVTCTPYGREPAPAMAGAAASSAAAAASTAAVTAVAFVALPERCLPQAVPPHPRYLQALLDGCGAYGLDGGFRDWLQSTLQAARGAAQPESGVAQAPPPFAVRSSDSAEEVDIGVGGGHGGGKGSEHGRMQRPGHEGQRLQNRRTGAKKAAAGLPRAATDW
ncbi:hypothetical protein HXX76_013736 [Chlamydomonas incerta]|uniref:Uncharacterized protein n=1 Tax=Chlamydomonas incerta TaxID=51695 RepID=A0A835VRP5_CHLIN|nr:hypothetical protein HXX76_013736 [Chlamydomonas incerta]|eukprot:KAG2425320.1 hypothetical protein HXX76_013736 [Chlamydomonas incerta]